MLSYNLRCLKLHSSLMLSYSFDPQCQGGKSNLAFTPIFIFLCYGIKVWITSSSAEAFTITIIFKYPINRFRV